MNLAQLIVFFLVGEVRDAVQAGVNHFTHTRRVLTLSLFLPVLLLVVGIVAGRVGYIGMADGCILAAGFIAALLLTLVLARTAVLATMLTIASAAARGVSPTAPTPVDRAQAEGFVRWFAGAAAWIITMSVVGQLLPLYQHIGATVGLATCALGVVAITIANWFNTVWMRYIGAATVGLLAIVYLATLTGVTESAAFKSVKTALGTQADRVMSLADKHTQRTEVEKRAEAAMSDIDRMLMDRLLTRQAEIRAEAVRKGCSGVCEVEAAENTRIERDLAGLKDGTYWQQRQAPQPASVTSPVTPARVVQPEPAGNKPAASCDAIKDADKRAFCKKYENLL